MKKNMMMAAVGAMMMTAAMSFPVYASQGQEELLQVMDRYQQEEYQAYLNAAEAVDMGDYYEIQAMLCVPVTFDYDPLAGKRDGDVISYSISDLDDSTAEAVVREEEQITNYFDYMLGRITEDQLDRQVELVAYGDWDYRSNYFPTEGKWHLVGSSDWEPAKEIFNGTLRLKKDAGIHVLKDDFTVDHTEISAEELIGQYAEYGMDDSLDIFEKAYFCDFTLELNEEGEIVDLTENWKC